MINCVKSLFKIIDCKNKKVIIKSGSHTLLTEETKGCPSNYGLRIKLYIRPNLIYLVVRGVCIYLWRRRIRAKPAMWVIYSLRFTAGM